MYPTLFVILLGLGTVFTGLILIIFLCKLMSLFVSTIEKEEPKAKAPSVTSAESNSNKKIANKQELLAVISATIAEELGTDISRIRIHSIKQI